MGIPLSSVHIAEISLKGIIAAGGSNTVNTNFIFHYRRTSTAVNPTKTALNTIFTSAVAAVVAAALNEDWSASLHDIRYPEDAEDQYQSFTATEVGAITGDRMDSFAAAFLLFRTGLRGRSFKGGKHLGPFSESDATAPDGDVFNAGALTRLTAINTALLTTLNDTTGNNWKLTLLSRKKSQLKTNPTTATYNDVTQALVNKRIGSLIRRKVKSVY